MTAPTMKSTPDTATSAAGGAPTIESAILATYKRVPSPEPSGGRSMVGA